jgi:hypothetical protein
VTGLFVHATSTIFVYVSNHGQREFVSFDGPPVRQRQTPLALLRFYERLQMMDQGFHFTRRQGELHVCSNVGILGLPAMRIALPTWHYPTA